MYYHGARYYAPGLARWVSCDPLGTVDGISLYRYAASNPSRLIDPNGKQSDDAAINTLNPKEPTNFISGESFAVANPDHPRDVSISIWNKAHPKPATSHIRTKASTNGTVPVNGAKIRSSGGVLDPNAPGDVPDGKHLQQRFAEMHGPKKRTVPANGSSPRADSGSGTSGGRKDSKSHAFALTMWLIKPRPLAV